MYQASEAIGFILNVYQAIEVIGWFYSTAFVLDVKFPLFALFTIVALLHSYLINNSVHLYLCLLHFVLQSW